MATKTLKTSKTIVTVTLERGVYDHENRLDGMLCSTERRYFENTEIAICDASGKRLTSGSKIEPLNKKHTHYAQAIKAGCVAMVGNAFLHPDTRDWIVNALAELEAENPKSDEQIALEAAEAKRRRIGEENLDRMAREYAERRQHPGWCDKCQSYCYGDCTA